MVDLASFQCKKWTLFTLCLVGIIVTLIITIVACKIVSDASPPAGSTKEDVKNWPVVQKAAKGIIIAIGVITILFEMLGLFGAYKEHFCMTLTYAILMTLATLGSIGSATRQASGWGNFVLNLLITIMAYLYARDLKKIQREKQYAGRAGYTA